MTGFAGTGVAAGVATTGVGVAPGAVEEAGVVFGVELLSAAFAGFLQAAKLSVRTKGIIANRVNIKSVQAFSLARGKNKRFLPRLAARS